MPVTINGNGSITGLSVGGLGSGVVNDATLASNAVTTTKIASGAISGATLPAGSIIQTVIGASETSTGSSVEITSTNAAAPTYFNSACNVTITPQFSNSKILITFTASIRLNPDAEGYVGPYYSSTSNFSSDVHILDPKRGASRNEAFRNNDGAGDAHIFWCISQTTWDETITNTNVRYYSVGGYKGGSAAIYYGDQGVGLKMMAQEIKV